MNNIEDIYGNVERILSVNDYDIQDLSHIDIDELENLDDIDNIEIVNKYYDSFKDLYSTARRYTGFDLDFSPDNMGYSEKDNKIKLFDIIAEN